MACFLTSFKSVLKQTFHPDPPLTALFNMPSHTDPAPPTHTSTLSSLSCQVFLHSIYQQLTRFSTSLSMFFPHGA